MQRAADRGELSADIDVSTIVAALLGPLFYRRWFSREPIDDPFVKTIIQRVLASL
ncbi:TetR/AcrR family transcriptional regulator C-terminal ligand-binding domain-containing protein [Paenibacillus sp. P26]|nr:TetR/AcrR family transcriptional regulator C-terminal ligand-binding domain-containing protein [Paenibacillus sp. P26]